VLKVWVDGHGRRRESRQGWTPSSHLGQCSLDSQLILRKISKIGANRCQILGLKRTKLAPDPAAGAYSAHRHPLAVFKGPTSKRRERKGRRDEVKRGR